MMCFLFLIFVAATGILLNHAESWGLFTKPLPAKLAQLLYPGIYPEDAYLYDLDEIDIYQIEQSLYLNDVMLEVNCPSGITGVSQLEGYIWVSCGDSLSLFDNAGALLEKIRLSGGNITALAGCQSGICVRQAGVWFALDETSLNRSELSADMPVSERLPTKTEVWPSFISHTPAELNFGRLIADFHSGTVAGNLGRFLVDLIGFAILFLSISGCYLWLGNKPR